jgi:hypothetical protein
MLCNNKYFCTFDSSMQLNNTHTHTEDTLVFPRERAAVLRYTYMV